MSESAGSAPAPQDPFAVAAAQTKSNKDTAAFNTALARYNQLTPFGSLTWEVDPNSGPQYNTQAYNDALKAYSGRGGVQSTEDWAYQPGGGGNDNDQGMRAGWYNSKTGQFQEQAPTGAGPAPKLTDFLISDGAPKYIAKQTLDPKIQALVDAQTAYQTERTGASSRALDSLESFAGTQFKPNARALDSGDGWREQITKAMYDRGARILDPRYAQEEAAQRQKLLDAGFSVQDAGFNKAMGNFQRNKDSAYADLADRAMLTGGQESDRIFAQSLAGHKQDIADALMERQVPMSELQALALGAGSPSGPMLPNFGAVPGGSGGASPTDIAGIFGNNFNQLNSIYQGNVSQSNANNATTGQVIGTAAMLAMMY